MTRGPKVKPRPALDKVRHLLGVLTDVQVAAQVKLPEYTVRAYRKRQGIEVGPRSRQRANRSKLDDCPDVGILPDPVVAEMTGFTVGTVRGYRQRRGIAAPPHIRKDGTVFSRRTREEPVVPMPALLGYAVTYIQESVEQVVIVAALNPGEAARIVEVRYSECAIREVLYLGPHI